MKKFMGFLVDKRIYVVIGMLLLTIVSVVLMNYVNINEDLTKYLPSNSEMKKGLDIMNDEFANINSTESFKIMFTGLSIEEKSTLYEELKTFDGVNEVVYDINSEEYNKDDYTMYEINTVFDSKTKTEEVINGVVGKYKSDYKMYYYYANGDDTVLTTIIPIALVILLVILLLMCNSYFEPVILLATIGVAVLINMGTNAILPNVSNMTNSIAAVLQLVLSMDYSIILINRYRQEKKWLGYTDNKQAMKNALINSFGSITSSSLTTFVGLLALLFMSFTIGRDMGIVLSKGVLLSLISVFTVLPSLILWCDKILVKTEKKSLKKNNNIGGIDDVK